IYRHVCQSRAVGEGGFAYAANTTWNCHASESGTGGKSHPSDRCDATGNRHTRQRSTGERPIFDSCNATRNFNVCQAAIAERGYSNPFYAIWNYDARQAGAAEHVTPDGSEVAGNFHSG